MPSNENPTYLDVDRLAARGLRQYGYGKLCADAPPDTSVRASQISSAMTGTFALTIAFAASTIFAFTLISSILIVAGAIFLLLVVFLITKSNPAYIAFLIVGLYILGVPYFLVFLSKDELAFTYGLPVLLVIAGLWGFRAIRGATALPLFLAAALIVVVAPLLTEDPWRFAPASGSRLFLFAAVAAIPLVVVVLFRLLRFGSVVPMYRALSNVVDREDASRLAANRIRMMLVQREDVRFSEDELAKRLDNAFTSEFVEATVVRLELLRLRKRFAVQAIYRYLTSLAGLALISFVIIYALAWAAMPVELAADWAKVSVDFVDLSRIGLPFSIPGTPYIEVSMLFSAIALIAYLAVSSTDDSYIENAGASAMLKPAETLALYYISYLYFKR